MLESESKPVFSERFVKLATAGSIIAIVGVIVWQINNVAGAIAILEFGNLLAIFLAGLAIGYVPVKLLSSGLSKYQRLIASIALGMGMLSLFVLFGGLAGLISGHWIWKCFVWLIGFIGAILVYVDIGKADENQGEIEGGSAVFEVGWSWQFVLILTLPFLVLALLCVTIPPGVLWSAEGYGYDVLEYHLQVPKEWLEHGGIFHLPYNVYANFPFNAELLYLLAMILKNSPFEAVYLAQMIHLGFAILFVLAVWMFTRDLGIKAASVATVASACCSWVMYLAPLAYNEMGMIFSGTVAAGIILTCWRTGKIDVNFARVGALVGLLLGISSGFKYTAVVMISMPLILLFFIVVLIKTRFYQALLAGAIAVVGWTITFCPYLIRNYVWTGNPVFPLAYKYFDGSDFDSVLAERWERGHEAGFANEKNFSDKFKNICPRLEKLYWAGFRNEIVDNFIAETYRTKGEFQKADEILHPPAILDLPKFGLAILILPWVIFFTRRQRLIDWLMLFVFLLQTFVWLFFTHLQGRFLIVWLVILPFLVARSASYVSDKKITFGNMFLLAVILISFGFNIDDCIGRYYRHCYTRDGKPINWFGQHRAFLEGQVPGYEQLAIINENSSAKTMLIAEAKAFYYCGKTIYWTVFNRNDFADVAKKPLHELKNYIAKVHPDFIFVNWAEADRLSRTYGFAKSIRPKIFYYLSSPPRFKVKRVGRWGRIIRYDNRPVPSRVLYRLIYSEKSYINKKQRKR